LEQDVFLGFELDTNYKLTWIFQGGRSRKSKNKRFLKDNKLF
jgi:hypothetical protein